MGVPPSAGQPHALLVRGHIKACKTMVASQYTRLTAAWSGTYSKLGMPSAGGALVKRGYARALHRHVQQVRGAGLRPPGMRTGPARVQEPRALGDVVGGVAACCQVCDVPLAVATQ